jgi:integrase
MKPTHQVRFWEIKTMKPDSNGKLRKRPYGVRWVTAGREHSEWFVTKALAKAHLAKLVQAANKGEAFDVGSGLPESMYRELHSPTLLRVAREFLDDVWAEMSPNSRMRLVDGLAVAVQGFVDAKINVDPGEVRRALTTVVLPPESARVVPTAELAAIAAWLEQHSRNVSELADETERTNLGRKLLVKLDGGKAKTSTIDTRRSTLIQALSFAVTRAYLETNPFAGVNLTRYQREVAIDPGVVVNPAQARSLLCAVTYARPRGTNRSWRPFFATLYFAGTRPGEARFLAEQHCELPASGWGELVLPNSLGNATVRYSDGEKFQVRPLKHRAEEATRRVPIPPELVRILAEHIDEHGSAPDGRIFSTAEGGPIPNASYTDIWRRARPYGLAPNHVKSPLARRPYDLRHAAVSSWIAAGVPLPEVARRAGHTVQMLTAVYAKVIYGSAAQMNRRIEAFLEDQD